MRCENIIIPDTGEFVEHAFVQTALEIKQSVERSHKRREKNQQYHDYGSFYYLLYDNDLFTALDGATLTRLLYLATYIPYRERTPSINGNPIRVADLPRVLRVSKRTARDFLNKCSQFGALQVSSGDAISAITLSKDYFYKGDFTKRIKKRYPNITRMNINTIRELYRKANPRFHKALAYLFRLLPYVNKQWNIVCLNPLEHEQDNLQYVTLGKLADIWGYDVSQINRLKQNLWNCRINDEELIINFATAPQTNEWKIFINPNLYYAGNKLGQVKILGGFCKLRS